VKKNKAHIMLESVLPEFHHYLAIHAFSTLQYQFQPQNVAVTTGQIKSS
jgi:hypothetical protein